jgi:hypothetical protein
VGDVAAAVVGSMLAISMKAITSIQAAMHMQMGERTLTQDELNMLSLVYRQSVNLELVRVVDGFAGLWSITAAPFTLGNTIYMKEWRNTHPKSYASTIVHECCHVWQNQHIGVRYIADALWARTLPNMGYTFEDELAIGHFHWQDFNKEAQAKLLELVYADGTRNGVRGEFYKDDPIMGNVEFKFTNTKFKETDYTVLARESVMYVRGAGVLAVPWN